MLALQGFSISRCKSIEKKYLFSLTIIAGPIGICILTALLSTYHYIGYMRLVYPVQGIPDRTGFMALFIYIVGLVLMMSSDCQKYYTLRYKKGLISEGNFSRTRNPNYLGEMMIYGGLVLTLPPESQWTGWAILLFIWSTLFTMNMIVKDQSLKKKDGWQQYSQTSNRLLPTIIQSNKLADTILYTILVVPAAAYLMARNYGYI